MKSKIQLILNAGLSAFIIYFSMYAFRKPFAAATFDQMEVFGWDLKIILVISQVMGYTLSKFIGIQFVSGTGYKRRGFFIILFILLAELALLGFAIVPIGFKPFFLFLNGIPLGMIWGFVFSYLEGRSLTELLASILSTSYIMASGMTKSVGKYLMTSFKVSEFWMPFTTGLIFLLPLLIGVWLIEQVPPPTADDIKNRRKRVTMTRQDRWFMFIGLAPGLIAITFLMFLLTAFRDLRDNFAAELWVYLGYGNSAAVFSQTEVFITVGVLVVLGLFFLIKDNLQALLKIHLVMGSGMLLLLVSTFLYETSSLLSPFLWMTLSGLGVYLAYVPMGSILFERMTAVFSYRGNAGFLIYIADAFGYLGSVWILLFKELFYPNLSVYAYFVQLLYVIGIVGLLCLGIAYFYFKLKAKQALTS